MTADLAYAVWCRARYLTPDADGETRADRNARFGQSDATPDWSVPASGQYLYDWFDDLCSGHNRVVNGRTQRITWADFSAWQQVSQNIVYPHEFAILRAMDTAYCEALEEELAYQNAKARERAEADAKAKGSGRGRKK